MENTRDHAVVLGASMAGLLAARVLSETFERVTIVDRDALTPADEQTEPRRGVPQGRQAHLLLSSGAQILEQLFPGFLDDLERRGVPVLRSMAEVNFRVGGHLLSQDAEASAPTYQPSRPFLEARVRERVLALPGVTVRDRCDAVGPVADQSGRRIVGVRVLPRADGGAEEVLATDLVVDATGRTGRTPAWLEQLGYPSPEPEELPVDLVYVSRYLRLPEGALGRERLVAVSAEPDRPTGMVLLAQEGDRWRLMVFGYGSEHHPPTHPDQYAAFAASVAPPHVRRALGSAEWLDDPRPHRFPSNLRRRYERLRRFPDGLLVTGDALCSFNPLYAQGMSMAAIEALELRRLLAESHDDLARRYFRAAAKRIDLAWQMAVGGDLALPQVKAPRPRSVRIVNAYIRRLQRAAATDPVVAYRFLQVTQLLRAPSTLLTPGTALRVLRAG